MVSHLEMAWAPEWGLTKPGLLAIYWDDPRGTLIANQTWLVGKSPNKNGGFNGEKKIERINHMDFPGHVWLVEATVYHVIGLFFRKYIQSITPAIYIILRVDLSRAQNSLAHALMMMSKKGQHFLNWCSSNLDPEAWYNFVYGWKGIDPQGFNADLKRCHKRNQPVDQPFTPWMCIPASKWLITNTQLQFTMICPILTKFHN